MKPKATQLNTDILFLCWEMLLLRQDSAPEGPVCPCSVGLFVSQYFSLIDSGITERALICEPFHPVDPHGKLLHRAEQRDRNGKKTALITTTTRALVPRETRLIHLSHRGAVWFLHCSYSTSSPDSDQILCDYHTLHISERVLTTDILTKLTVAYGRTIHLNIIDLQYGQVQ